MAALIDVPELVTAAQMYAWCCDFDNWVICDTVCFNLFDLAATAWAMVDRWAANDAELVERGAFALLWSLAFHDKTADDAHFIHGLELIEREAANAHNFVTKAIPMALRAFSRSNARLTVEVLDIAQRLELSTAPTSRREGRASVKELRARK